MISSCPSVDVLSCRVCAMLSFSYNSLQSIFKCWFFFIKSSIWPSFLFSVSLLYIYSFYTLPFSLLYFMTFSWHLLSICWFWSLSFDNFYSKDFTFCYWLLIKFYFSLKCFSLSSWMVNLRESDYLECYADFYLSYLHYL